MKRPNNKLDQDTHFKDPNKILQRAIVKSVTNAFFLNGDLTRDDLALPPEEYSRKVVELINRTDFAFNIDHRNDIIKKADHFLGQNDANYAKILYAMFFEHSINYLIHLICNKRKIDSKNKNEIIKSVNIRGKMTWLLKLLGLPEFNKKHQNTIVNLADERNAFVHYKWNEAVDKMENESNSNKSEDDIEKIRLAIRYMKLYSSNVLYQKSKKKLERKVKEK